MSGFLDQMAASSRQRVAAARGLLPAAALERQIGALEPPPPLRLSPQGFDVIAEIKLRSPAAGLLGRAGDDWLGRAESYARAGAAAVSVLTEPSRFDGSLGHLREVAARLAPLGVPAMRKDFLVDPYQVLEARAAGAGGVLLILRMLDRAGLVALLDAAAEHGLFVLLEAFDEADLVLAGELLGARAVPVAPVLVGVNCRDLQTLAVQPQRFAPLARSLPAGAPAVAESGVADAAAAREVRRLGYGLALVGSALMSSPDPAALLDALLRAGRSPLT